MLLKKAILSSVLLSLVSCAQNSRRFKKSKISKKTPTQTIKSFKYETESLELDSVIRTSKETTATSNFLRTHRSKKVNFWVNYYSRVDKKGFQKHLNNGEKYRNLVQNIFRQYSLPPELYYVGIIESGYKNHARSHASAVGPWQFIKDTGKRYGLKVSRYIDERKNIYKSTHAAALYFQDLYNIFGSWELALAAYNAGEYGIIRRIRGANTRDFYKLSEKKVLPKETRQYVPKIIAAMTVGENKRKYGIKVKPQRNTIYENAKAVKISNKSSLKQLSRRTNTPISIIKKLNHDIKTNYLPLYRKKKFEVYIPSNKKFSKFAHTKKKTQPSIFSLRVKSKSLTTKYKVKQGDNLGKIARKFKTTITGLKRNNNIKGSSIYIGQTLRIRGLKKNSQRTIAATKSYRTNTYKVKRGDTLYSISRKFNTRVPHIKKLNNMKKSNILLGQVLKVPASKKVIHTVRKGDFLSTIARRYKVPQSKIKDLNKLESTSIYPGQKLIISVKRI